MPVLTCTLMYCRLCNPGIRLLIKTPTPQSTYDEEDEDLGTYVGPKSWYPHACGIICCISIKYAKYGIL